MQRRTRLRRRLFVMTALNALVLLGITLMLTWRARESHREVHQLVMVDGRAVQTLDQLRRMQSAFRSQLEAALTNDGRDLPRLAQRYRTMSHLLDGVGDSVALQNDVRTFGQSLEATAGAWPGAEAEWRELTRRDLLSRSDRIGSEFNRVMMLRQNGIEQKIPDLELSATNTMFVALGIVYIVAIFSFVAAKLTLAKVVSPLEHLTAAARKIKDGDYSSRVRVGGDLEIAELGARFNEMMDSLARMNEELSLQARTDDLTGLPNFRSFQAAIQLEIERANRYEGTFGVLVFDLDHFKRYNDTHGHLAGNEALKNVSAVIGRGLRAVDSPARYGGEEFAAIVPQIDGAGLQVIAERIRRGVEELPVAPDRSLLTVSVGGAIFPHDGRTATELFAVADARLYEAKRDGRNRVVVPVIEPTVSPRHKRLIS